jgi:hypothetical protein
LGRPAAARRVKWFVRQNANVHSVLKRETLGDK